MAPPTPSPTPPAEPVRAAKYRVFAVLWAVCLLFDLSGRGLAGSPAAALVSAGAVGVLLAPRRPWILAATGALYVANVLTRPGFLFVHWYFDALVGAVLALAWVDRAVRRRTLAVEEADMLDAVGPAARALVLLAIGSAGLSKLNTMFLDPENSCGVALYLAQAHAPGFRWILPDATWARVVAIGLAVSAEVGVPALVLVPALRPLAMVLAAVFFFLLGINPVAHLFEFAGPMLALLFLFTADDLPARIGARLPALGRARWVASAVLVLGVLAAAFAGESEGARQVRLALCRGLWVVGVPGLLAAYLWHLPPLRDRLRFGAMFRGGAPAAWVLPLLMLGNEGLTYLGFPHNMTFTMASDLRMLGGSTNHVLLSPPVLPGNRPVRIVKSNDGFLRLVSIEGARLPWVSLRFRLSKAPNARVTFQVAGEPEPEIVPRAGDDPRFQGEPFLGQLLFYTEQPMDRRCSHWGAAAP